MIKIENVFTGYRGRAYVQKKASQRNKQRITGIDRGIFSDRLRQSGGCSEGKKGKFAVCGRYWLNFLITCLKGEGLLKVGADTAILQIVPTSKEFEFVETNLNKLVERQKNI